MRALMAALAAALAFSAFAAAEEESATIADAAWLTGRWAGQGLGGEVEEVWSPPVGGQMVGHFRLTRAGAPAFYEIMVIDVVDGGLRMRIKHFDPDPDLTAWEEKDEWAVFGPVKQPEAKDGSNPDERELHFDGLGIRRIGPYTLEMTVEIHSADGVRAEMLRVTRAPL